MTENIGVYVSVLRDSLKDKWEVMENIHKVSTRQSKILQMQEPDMEAFDATLQEKEKLIAKMQELDKGFESIYSKIDQDLHKQKEEYRSQILEMQNYIRLITELSVKIQTLEAKNKDLFVGFSQRKHKEIRDFKVSNKTATTYYQNMANQHHQWQSYFLDKKK